MTTSCFLDGRYIAAALASVDEFEPEPITIDVVFDAHGEPLVESIRSDFFQLQPGVNIVRVVVRSTYMRHSALLWINTDDATATYTDCVGRERMHAGTASVGERMHAGTAKVHAAVDRLLSQYVAVFGYTLVVDRISVPPVSGGKDCAQTGFCNAYVIKQVWDWQDGSVFDPTSFDVRDFAGRIERDFADQIDATKPVEVEYFIGAGLGLGLIGGLALGGLVASSARPAYGGYYPAPYGYYPAY